MTYISFMREVSVCRHNRLLAQIAERNTFLSLPFRLPESLKGVQ